MKITVTMKDPDTLSDAVREAVERDVRKLGLADDEQDALIESRVDKEMEKMSNWFEYSEYLSVEFDTTTMKAVVQKRSR